MPSFVILQSSSRTGTRGETFDAILCDPDAVTGRPDRRTDTPVKIRCLSERVLSVDGEPRAIISSIGQDGAGTYLVGGSTKGLRNRERRTALAKASSPDSSLKVCNCFNWIRTEREAATAAPRSIGCPETSGQQHKHLCLHPGLRRCRYRCRSAGLRTRSKWIAIVCHSVCCRQQSGWDQTVDVRTFQDSSGGAIDLNHDGITDFVGMGPQGLEFAFGSVDASGHYSLGPLQFANLGTNNAPNTPNLWEAQGWTDSNSLREVEHDPVTGFDDIIAFTAAWFILGLIAVVIAQVCAFYGMARRSEAMASLRDEQISAPTQCSALSTLEL